MQKIEQQLLPPKQLDLSSNDKCLVPGMQTIDRKKYKLSAASRNEQEICRIRNTIELRKRLQEGELVQELDNEEEDAVPGKHQDVAIVLDGDDGPPEPEPVQTDPFEQRIILLKREKDRRSKDSSKSPILRPQSEG